MKDEIRLEELARSHGAIAPRRCEPLVRPPDPDFGGIAFRGRVIDILARSRAEKGHVKDPSKGLKGFVRSKSKIEQMRDPNTWNFSLNEIRDAIDEALRRREPAAVVQAFIEFPAQGRLDVNIRWREEPGKGSKRRSTSEVKEEKSKWLEQVVGMNLFDHARLFASRGARQEALDRALGTALTNNSRPIIRELFVFGANANSHHQFFQRAVESDDVELVTLFLQAQPLKTLTVDQLNSAVQYAVTHSLYTITGILLAHNAEPNWRAGRLLESLVSSSNLRMISLLLCHSKGMRPGYLLKGVESAGSCGDRQMRTQLLDLLLSAGAPTDATAFHGLLYSAVREDQVDLIEMLIHHGVSPEGNENAAMMLAVENKQRECLDALLNGPISLSSATMLIDHIPVNASQDEALYMASTLFAKGAQDGEWGQVLINSIERGYRELVAALVNHGASIDYNDAHAVRMALERSDIDLLQLLLQGRSTPSVLAKSIPDAVRLSSDSDRREAVIALLEKKVVGDELHIALQTVCRTPSLRDIEVIRALLRHGASVDFKVQEDNCVCNAVQLADFDLLSMLCEHNPSDQVLSAAFTVAFESRNQTSRTEVLNIMDLLLHKGAQGKAVTDALVNVVRMEEERDILRLLLKHGTDVNFKSGLPIQEALQAPSTSALQQICGHARIESGTFDRLIPLALKRQDYKTRGAMLVRASSKYRSVLSRALVFEITHLGGREEAVQMLLENGASVNYESGEALSSAVRAENLKLARRLSQNIDNGTLSKAFRVAIALESSDMRRRMMEFLLSQTSAHAEIGQNEGLVAECRRAASADIAIVNLLLQHNANVDFQDGAALIHAISARSAEILTILLSKKPDQPSLSTAFTAVRQTTCSIQKRLEMFKLVLQAGYRGELMNNALVEAITARPDDLTIPQLLLQHNASVDYDDGLPLNSAVRSGNDLLVQMLMVKHPNPKTLENAFRSARLLQIAENRRISIYTSLLRTHSIPVHEISGALIDAVRLDYQDTQLFRLLLNCEASLDYNDGTALCMVVDKADLPKATLFLELQSATTKTLNNAFDVAFGLGKQERLSFANLLLPHGVSSHALSKYLTHAVAQQDHELLRLLVFHHADTEFQGGEALVASASNGDPVSFRILMPSTVNPAIIGRAFEAAMRARAVETSSGGLDTVKLLLRQGVSQNLRDMALLDVFQSYTQHRDEFVELLLEHGADVNLQDGECFLAATNMQGPSLFDSLLNHGPNLGIIVPRLMAYVTSEEHLVALLRRCFAQAPNFFDNQDNRLLFLAMERFPAGVSLVKLLLDYGCKAGATQLQKLKPNYEAEQLTPLLWALYQPRPGIRDSVLTVLLERGSEANPSFITKNTRKTAIFKATKTSRHAILKKLVELKVNVNTRNQKRRTPLFYASHNGDLTAVDILHTAGANPNDGSIQEAAREAHVEVVFHLLHKGHDPEHPSSLHQGRSALAEMCFLAEPWGLDWEAKAYQIMQMLLRKGASVKEKYGTPDKTILHLALDNDSPLEVTRTLLEFEQIWKRINDDDFLYEDQQGVCYSPTKYVERFYVGSEDGMRQILIDLLHSKRCKDRLFSRRGDHPQGAEGLPDHLREIRDREALEDRQLEQSLARMRLMTERQIELSNLQFDNELRQERVRDANQAQLGQNRHQRQLLWNREVQEANRLAISREHELRLNNQAAAAVQSREIENTNRLADLEHMRRIAEAEQRRTDANINARRQWLQETDASFRMRSNEMRALADAWRNTGVNGNGLGMLTDGHTID